MSRTHLTIPTRLQVLSFFLLVENVVKHVIARLREAPDAPVEAPTAGVDLSNLREEIQQALNELRETQSSLQQQQEAHQSLVDFALLSDLHGHNPLSPLALSLFLSKPPAPGVEPSPTPDDK